MTEPRVGPRRAREPAGIGGFVLVVVTLALVAVVAAWVADPVTTVDLPAALLFGLAVVTAWLPIQFRFRGTVHGSHLGEAALVPMLFLVPLGGIAISFALAMGAVMLVQRRQPWQIALGAAQLGAAGAAGGAVFRLIAGRPEAVLGTRAVIGLVLSALAFNAIGVAVFHEGRRRLTGSPYGETWRAMRAINAVTWGIGTIVGVVTATVAVQEPAIVALIGALLAAISFALRDWAGAEEQRHRIGDLYKATRALARGDDPADATTYLRNLTSAFGASSAALTIVTSEGVEQTTVDAESSDRRTLTEADVVTALALESGDVVHIADTHDQHGHVLAKAGAHDAILAPLTYEGQRLGVLAVFDQVRDRPWTGDDVAFLRSVADEAAIAVRNAQLYAALVEERDRMVEETGKLSDIVQGASDGIALIGTDGRVSTWNAAMERSTGTTEERALGEPWHLAINLVGGPSDPSRTTANTAFRAALEGTRGIEGIDLRIRRPTGGLRWVRCAFSPVRRTTGVVGVVLLAHDVTEEHEIEEQKVDFVATVSHELRTPLTPLKGFAETGLHRWRSLDPEHLDELFAAMLRQIERLEDLVGDLLAVADLDRGTTEITAQDVDLARLLVAAGGMVVRPEEASRLTIDDRDGFVAHTDRRATARVIRELIHNALKHSSGPVAVRLSQRGHEVGVHVIDRGAGIAPWHQQRVFDRFSRLESHLHLQHGPGLGLAIARSLAEQCGGRIELDSEVGAGSTFTAWFPAATSEERVPDEVEQA